MPNWHDQTLTTSAIEAMNESISHGPKQDFPLDRCVHELFQVHAQQTPDALAVCDRGTELRYRELEQKASVLAHQLSSFGIGQDQRVAVCLGRSADWLIAILAVLKAGAAYVAMDPHHPRARLAFMVEDSAATVVLTDRCRADRFAGCKTTVIELDAYWEHAPAVPVGSNLPAGRIDSLAYVIYTSGTTGRPKGVAVEHASLLNLVFWHKQAFAVTAQDRASVVAGLGFDAAVWEVWPYLAWGASLHLPEDHLRSSHEALRDWLIEQSITIAFLPTPIAEAIVELPWPSDVPLRFLLTGGDRLRAFPSRTLPFGYINNYGPTENTVVATSGPVRREPEGLTAPSIGRPISNNTAYILDSARQPVPVGEEGELYIGGRSLARGYLNNLELTAESFVKDPFSDDPRARLYKTGDRVRLLSNGDIEFRGRLDDQVKMRGYRIELGEIESALQSHPLVRQAVVLASEDTTGPAELTAYVVPEKTENDEESATHLAQWESLYDQVYSQEPEAQDRTSNFIGWNSSYTGQPIAEAEMLEWVKATTDRIAHLKPRRVLEIGCGTGLLLARIAPGCERYVATDFSDSGLGRVRELIASSSRYERVELRKQLADDFAGIGADEFDLVILNSVIQYFPSAAYLLKVLDGAVRVVANGGHVFVGDVRSLPLLETYALSVHLHRAAKDADRSVIQERVRRDVEHEDELFLAPEFFRALEDRFPRISYVQIEPKRGRAHNELTRFRYEAILSVGDPIARTALVGKDWVKDGLTFDALSSLLREQGTRALAIKGVPNARLAHEAQALDWLFGDTGPATVGEFRQTLLPNGIEPDALVELGESLGFRVTLDWSQPGRDGRFDAVFEPIRSDARFVIEREAWPRRPLREYANNPLPDISFERLAYTLSERLCEQLPEYMCPSAYAFLSELPLTPNGKVDRTALFAADSDTAGARFVRPSTGASAEQTVQKVRDTIAESELPTLRGRLLTSEPRERARLLESYLAFRLGAALGVDPSGLPSAEDLANLGVHSLMIARMLTTIDQDLGLRVHPREFFEHPSIEQLAAYLSSELLPAPREASSSSAFSGTGGTFTLLSPGGHRRSHPAPSQLIPGPVFILSTPRAGSTLLRVMLAGHPGLFCPPELHLLPFHSMRERAEALGESNLDEGLERALMELRGVSAEEAQQLTQDLEQKDATVQDVYKLLQDLVPGRILVDKSASYGFDIQTLEWAEMLFDRPRYIHLIRHPYSVIESMARHRHNRLLGATDADPHHFAEQAWATVNANIADFAECIDEDRFTRVKYEDLVRDPRRVMTGLCEFLNIQFDDRVLKPYEGSRMTDGLHEHSLPLSDPSFHTHDDIDPLLGEAWKKIKLPMRLGGFARRVAAEFDYVLPADVARKRRRHDAGEYALMPFQTEGERPPFFIVHPLSGIPLVYRDLADHLGSDQPFYGIQTPSLYGGRDVPSTVEEMAGEYVSAIRSVQPYGPYFLGGYSSGGMICFEMAQQLQRLGEEVAVLALLDAGIPWAPPELKPFMQDVIDGIGEASWISGWRIILDVFSHDSIDQERAVLYGEASMEETEKKHVKVIRDNLRACIGYTPQIYSGRLILFRSSEHLAVKEIPIDGASLKRIRRDFIRSFIKSALQLHNWPKIPGIIRHARRLAAASKADPSERSQDRGWSRLSTEPLEIHQVSGNHVSMLFEPQVRELAVCLRGAIDERISRG